ncbi:hypothetical protein [Halomontanus rarus]|uniref:hypothetical protein n=1 Tax=Halomontanus rarus TaxID=3034020 RepID=UPI0023E884C9|nr:hypothetical protein [Halovivax sp. TS33]
MSPDEYDGTGDLPDRLAFVKPDRARLWIDLYDRDDVPTAATLADGHDVSTATIYRMLEELAELGLAENVSTYRDGRATTGFRALEPGTDNSREILADGSGPVFEGGRATTCPDCGSDLQYQNRQSILCLGCEQDYEHWKNASSHHLVEVDERTGESEIVESTLRDVETDGGRSSNGTERRLTCEHGEWKESPSSSLSSIWCHRCEDMVEVEFRNVQTDTNQPEADR